MVLQGYVSVAYKKIYLEAGKYSRSWNYYSNLKYLDIDQDYCKVAIIPATNDIEPSNNYESNPSYLNNYVTSNTYSSNRTSWGSSSGDFTITNAGNYYIVFAFIATDKITKGSYSVRLIDNLGAPIINKQITITKIMQNIKIFLYK